ncbi:MAG: zinc ribbon domain-containing protein [Dissulfurispiraceae bacterium]|nr:zinc ribbon domain-containing protein [Dissulfurispiraceae bacterium]
MPIFEYKCEKCSEEFEKLVHGSHTVKCPKCSSENVVKKFSVFGMSGVERQTSSACSSCTSGSCSTCK